MRIRISAAVVAVATVGAVVVSACGSDNEECSSCPPIEGTWAISAGAPDQACANGRAPPQALSITRVGSIIRADIEGSELTGTVFDTFDFSLTGSVGDQVSGADGGAVKGPDTVNIRAKFVQGNGDGGSDTFRGTWAFTPGADAGTQSCTETRQLDAVKVR
jgi:hypothetical protein